MGPRLFQGNLGEGEIFFHLARLNTLASLAPWQPITWRTNWTLRDSNPLAPRFFMSRPSGEKELEPYFDRGKCSNVNTFLKKNPWTPELWHVWRGD